MNKLTYIDQRIVQNTAPVSEILHHQKQEININGKLDDLEKHSNELPAARVHRQPALRNKKR